MVHKNIIIYWLPVILWAGFLFAMSTGAFNASQTSRFIEPFLRFIFPDAPKATIVFLHGIIRKMAHVTEYFVMGLLLYRAFKNQFSTLTTGWHVFYSLLIIMLLAGADEFHQSFVSTRTASIVDVGIDTFGGLLGLCVLLQWNRNKPKDLKK